MKNNCVSVLATQEWIKGKPKGWMLTDGKPVPDALNGPFRQFQNSNNQNTFGGLQMQASTCSSKVKNRRLILE